MNALMTVGVVFFAIRCLLLDTVYSHRHTQQETEQILFAAWKADDRAAVLEFLSRLDDKINLADEDGDTILHWAAYSGYMEIVALLALVPHALYSVNRLGESPLQDAVIGNHVDIVAFFLEQHVNVDVGKEWTTALESAIGANQIEIARLLLRKGAEVHGMQFGQGLFHKAMLLERLEIMRIFMQFKLIGDCEWDALQWNLLHIAVYQGDLQTVRQLMSKIYVYLHYGNDYFSSTLLHDAALLNRPEMLKLFIHNRYDVSPCDSLEMTPLHIAAQEGHEDIVDILLEKGAQINARDRKDRTALDLAEAHGYEAIVVKLQSRNACRGGDVSRAISDRPRYNVADWRRNSHLPSNDGIVDI